MRRNQQSKQSLDQFMGGYSNFTWPWQIGGVADKIKHFKGDENKVRLFQHCLSDNNFENGWVDEITPKSNGTVRLRLGYKGDTTNDNLSAVYIPSGYDVVLHEHARGESNFQSGKHKLLRTSDTCLSASWNDIVTEIDIIPQGNIINGLMPWKQQVNSYPIDTVGQYPLPTNVATTTPPGGFWGGLFGQAEMCYKCLKPGIWTKTTKKWQTNGCDEQTWFKRKQDACPSITPLVEAEAPDRGVGNEVADGPIQYGGCTYPSATNYNSSATFDDGSCTYSSGSGSASSGSGSAYIPPYTPPYTPPRPAAPVVAPVVAPARAPLMIPEEKEGMLQNPLVWGAIALAVVGIGYLMTDTKKVATAKSGVVPSSVKTKSGRKK